MADIGGVREISVGIVLHSVGYAPQFDASTSVDLTAFVNLLPRSTGIAESLWR